MKPLPFWREKLYTAEQALAALDTKVKKTQCTLQTEHNFRANGRIVDESRLARCTTTLVRLRHERKKIVSRIAYIKTMIRDYPPLTRYTRAEVV